MMGLVGAGVCVHEGVWYEREKGEVFWYPATDYSLREYHKGVDATVGKVDPNAPLLCECGSTGFSIKSPPGEYKTSARCLKCGVEAVIHEG